MLRWVVSTTNEKPLKGNYYFWRICELDNMYFESSNSYELSGLLGELIACRLWPSRASRCDIGTQSSDSSFVVMVCSHWPNQESWLRHHPCISTVSVNEHFHAILFHPLYFPASWLCLRWCEYTTSGCLLQSDFWHLRQLLPVILETRSMLAQIARLVQEQNLQSQV